MPMRAATSGPVRALQPSSVPTSFSSPQDQEDLEAKARVACAWMRTGPKSHSAPGVPGRQASLPNNLRRLLRRFKLESESHFLIFNLPLRLFGNFEVGLHAFEFLSQMKGVHGVETGSPGNLPVISQKNNDLKQIARDLVGDL